MRAAALPLLALGILAWCAHPAQALAETSCVQCHGAAEVFGEGVVALGAEDAHAAAGLSCQDCHGGNPDPALGGRMEAAMDPDFSPNPYRGAPERTAVPEFCGRCHADAAYMKQFRAEPRVDQLERYRTSRHGTALARGDTAVATCIDCHGVHEIRGPDDAASPVYPTQVAETCSGCHADPRHMAGYDLPTDQRARWAQSVHGRAMERGELSAPTCNDCHGNHGALPPGFDRVAFVCGECHAREAELYQASPKHAGFEEHRELLAAVGPQGCGACHGDSHPASRLPRRVTLEGCPTCHRSHGIFRPTITMVSPLPPAPCQICHGQPAAEGGRWLVREPGAEFAEVFGDLLERAARRGLEGEARFDWLVDRAWTLPQHSVGPAGARQLREEVGRLFQRYRIGKTFHPYVPPGSREPEREEILACNDCHAYGASGERAGPGAPYAEILRSLAGTTAQAERTLLVARRGGVDVSDIVPHIEAALHAHVRLQVLVHAFAPGGELRRAADDGTEHARTALGEGRAALDELARRRRGLLAFLALVLLALVAVVLKIRQLGPG